MNRSAASSRILIADDQSAVREALRLLLDAENYEVLLAAAPEEVLEALATTNVDLVLLDLNYTRGTTSGREGLDLLTKICQSEDSPPVVVMTAWATVELAVATMQRGARDFFQKPWDNERVLAIVRTQLRMGVIERRNRRLESENQLLRQEIASPLPDTAYELVAESEVMKSVLATLRRIAPSDANVLVTGENGTGKGVIARLLHTWSERANKPFITVNIGGLSDSLFQSELFGHVKGAFTDAKQDRAGRFEIAEGGTLFLDEIGNLGLPQQAQLLRTVETGEFERLGSSRTRQANVRLVSATNADLPTEVKEGCFRRDLYFRLNTVEIRLPGLRDRVADILPLAHRFLQIHATRYRKNVTGFTAEAEKSLRKHDWPGNVRELDHAVERGVLLTDNDRIGQPELGLVPLPSDPVEIPARLESMTVEEIERVLIFKALDRAGGNAARAAEALGISRSTFYRRLQQYGVNLGKCS